MITGDTPTVQVSPIKGERKNQVKGGTAEMISGRTERYFNKEDEKGEQSNEHAY